MPTGFEKISRDDLESLQGKTVAVTGLGSVGSTMCAMMARESLDLRLIDMGRVEEEDMHRLALFHEEDITKFKVKQAKIRIAAINPKVQVKSFHEELTESNIFLLQGDVIVDASNNNEINALTIPYAAKKKLPLVLVRIGGSQAKILILQKAPPAKIAEKLRVPSSEKAGIFGPATNMAAALAVSHAMQIMLGEKGSFLIELDAWEAKTKVTKL